MIPWCEDAILFLWVTASSLSCYWLRALLIDSFQGWNRVGISCVAKWAGLICIGLLRVVRARFAFSICTNFYLYYLKCFCFLLRHFFMYVTVASLISDYVIYMDVSFQCLVVLVYLLTRGSKQDMIQKLNTMIQITHYKNWNELGANQYFQLWQTRSKKEMKYPHD